MKFHTEWKASSEQICVVNLSEGFNPIKGENIYRLSFGDFKFPDRSQHFTIHVDNVTPQAGVVYITSQWEGMETLTKILLVNDALRRAGFPVVRLYLPYIPARQDRVCNPGEPLSVKVIADMINSCGFDSVETLEPHSDVLPALINNVRLINDHDLLDIVRQFCGRAVNIIAPDAGAAKRAHKIIDWFAKHHSYIKTNFVQGTKHRDTKTGQLTGFGIDTAELPRGVNLVVDDVCANGGTFLGLAEVLKQKTDDPIMIFVYHADCKKGLDNLANVYDHVFTTNSQPHHKAGAKVTIIQA